VANVLAAVSQWEADAISERTSAALQALRAQGVTLGNPNRIPDDVVQRMKRWRGRGWSLPKIARRLNELEVPTARGGTWHAGTVRAALERTRGRKARRGSTGD